MPRDKFAAMASRAAAATTAESSDTGPSAIGKSESESGGEPAKGVEGAATPISAVVGMTAPTPASPRRDKLAAMAARGHSPVPPNSPKRGGNKLAAMVARETNNSPVPPPSRDNDKKAKHEAEAASAAQQRRADHLSKLQTRLNQREEILQRLDRAEDLTLELLQIAGQTTDALQDLHLAANVTSSSSSSALPRLDLTRLSAAYRATLKEIHPLLTQDGTEDLIRPYQNHTREDTQQHHHQQQQSVYTARVEMRLAQERASVLRAFTELEHQGQLLVDESSDADGTRVAPGDKRKREGGGSGE